MYGWHKKHRNKKGMLHSETLAVHESYKQAYCNISLHLAVVCFPLDIYHNTGSLCRANKCFIPLSHYSICVTKLLPLCPTSLHLFAACTLTDNFIVWSIHVMGTAASSAPVPMPCNVARHKVSTYVYIAIH